MLRLHNDHDAVDWHALSRDLIDDRFDNGRTPRQLELSFRQSFAAAYACDGKRVIGTARVLSDGVCNAYLVDLWTHSSYRKRGIARRMIELLCERLQGQHLCLFTDDAPQFYAACGFARRGIAFERVVGEWLQNETRC
jgi:predicted GNAT family acetyltransferase